MSPALQADSLPLNQWGSPMISYRYVIPFTFQSAFTSSTIDPLCSQEDLPDPGIKPGSPALQADSSLSELPWKHLVYIYGSGKILTSIAFQYQKCPGLDDKR